MTTFLIVLIVILVICCCVMLYLYFSVRKEADNYENEYLRYSKLYEEYQNMYHVSMKHWGEARYKLYLAKKKLEEKNSRIRQLEASFNDHTINIRTFGPHIDYFKGSMDIPSELRNPENDFDPFDAPMIDQDIRNKIVKMLGEDVLKHTGFAMRYDINHHSYNMVYICPICVENKYADNKEFFYLDPEAKMPMLDIIKKLYEKDKEDIDE